LLIISNTSSLIKAFTEFLKLYRVLKVKAIAARRPIMLKLAVTGFIIVK
jgi:hypothetical protein